MATLSITKSYADAQILFEADLDAMKSSIETFVNTTKLNDDNIQNQGITGSTKLADLSVATANLEDETLGSSNFDASAVTTAKLGSSAIIAAKIDSSAVTAAKIASEGVPRTALYTPAVATSSTAVSLSPTDITSVPTSPYSGLTVSFTPTRTDIPVVISLIGDANCRISTPVNDSHEHLWFAISLFKDGVRQGDLALINDVFIVNDSGITYVCELSGPIASFVIPSGLTAGTSYTFGFNIYNKTSGHAVAFNDAKIRVWEMI
jgi:hypothetical protein